MENEAELRSPIHLPFEAFTAMWLGAVENWVHSIDPMLAAGIFIFQGISLIAETILRCNTFAWIQKTGVDHTGSRPPNSYHDFLVQVCFEKCVELLLSPTTELVVSSCYIQIHFHHASQSNPETPLLLCTIVMTLLKITVGFFFNFQSVLSIHLSSFTFPICLNAE